MLRTLARGKRVVEIGALLGFSTVTMAQVAESVISIDPHDGYPFYNPSPTLPIFRHNLDRYAVSDKVEVRVSNAQHFFGKARRVGKERAKEPGDAFTFIDCTGFYADTAFCLSHAPVGTIACHDFGRRGCAGVDQAVRDYLKKSGRKLTVIDTLAIID